VSSGLAVVRAAIKTTLDSVTGIGATFDYFRGAQDMTEAERDALMATVGGRFHVWFLSMADERPYLTKRYPATHEHSVYGFSLHGYYAVDEANASEKTFALLCEAVIAKFRQAKPGLASSAFTNVVDEQGPVEWVVSGHKTFCGVLCHYARLDVATREQTEP
jgi:hypothetical protein